VVRLVEGTLSAPTIKHILFPFDFSQQGLQVAPFVAAAARRFDATVTVLGVVPPSFDAAPAGIGRVGETTAEWTHALHARLDAVPIEAFTGIDVKRVALSGDPAFKITEFAHDHRVDLIAMPTHGLGMFRSLLMGSVTSKVLHDANCPVWTAAHIETQPTHDLPRTILCALDGSRDNPALLRWTAAFSATVGATLKLLHVVRSITDWPSLESERAIQDEFRQEARAQIESMQASAGVEAPLEVVVGEIVPLLGDRAKDADLVVIGRGSLSSTLGRLRTHAYQIIQRSPCPVISV
jgi:nucleotide-binding universal stress UspA family protein